MGHAFSLEKVKYSLHVTNRLQKVEIYFNLMMCDGLYSLMLDLEMLTLGHRSFIGDRFCEMTFYAKHIFSKDYLALRAYPFEEDVFILGHRHLVDFDIKT